ncbi:MAG: hypothetical protein NVSMB53_05980 [Gemmatimonadaceae bacterium]
MRFHRSNGWYLACLLLALATSIVLSPAASYAQGKSAVSPAPLSPDLEAARVALAKYADPFVAVRDGYFSTLACMDFPNGATDGAIEYPPGAMGVHLLNPANIGPKLDPTKPQVLIYEPVGDKLVLAGAEWFVPVAASGGVVPTIFGQTLAGPMDGHEPIMPVGLRHYDLHVWLWKANPRGMFTSTNSALKCTSGAPYTIAVGADHHH